MLKIEFERFIGNKYKISALLWKKNPFHNYLAVTTWPLYLLVDIIGQSHCVFFHFLTASSWVLIMTFFLSVAHFIVSSAASTFQWIDPNYGNNSDTPQSMWFYRRKWIFINVAFNCQKPFSDSCKLYKSETHQKNIYILPYRTFLCGSFQHIKEANL